MAQPPWKDALTRARRSPSAAAPAPASAPPGRPPVSPAEALAAAPALAPLLAERQAIEQRMASLTGQSPADPRYIVEPLDRRREALAAWGQSRDAQRESARTTPALQAQPPNRDTQNLHTQNRDPQIPPPPLRPTAADRLRSTAADHLRGTPAETLRPTAAESMRPTAGERPAADRLQSIAEVAMRSAPRAQGPATPPLRTLDQPPPEQRRRNSPSPRAAPDPGPRRTTSAPQAMLDRRLTRARNIARNARRSLESADRALDAARDAIPNDWRQRRQAHIPGFGRDDPYVRETARKLSVAVGTLQELGEKADRLRSLARDARELKAAEDSNDEARRTRALERLKARRQED